MDPPTYLPLGPPPGPRLLTTSEGRATSTSEGRATSTSKGRATATSEGRANSIPQATASATLCGERTAQRKRSLTESAVADPSLLAYNLPKASPLRTTTERRKSYMKDPTKRKSGDKINLDVLLPNGVLLETVVDETISVFELKLIILGKVFEQGSHYPRVGLMTDSPYCYSLTYITRKGTRKMIENDEQRLYELNMSLSLIKMTKIDDGIKNVETETDIGLLIGQKLSNFVIVRQAEVNDFRWTMKVFTSDIARKRQAGLENNWRNKLSYQFPALIQDHNTPIVEQAMRSGNNSVRINVKHEEKTVTRQVGRGCLPSEVIAEVLGRDCAQLDKYCLKVYGREEYLVEEQPLCTFSSVLEDVVQHGEAFLVMQHKEDIALQVASKDVYSSLLRTPSVRDSRAPRDRIHSQSVNGWFNNRNKMDVSSLDVTDPLMLEVGQLKLKTPDWMDVSADGLAKGLFLRFAIYHGTVAVCPWADTPIGDILTNGTEEGGGAITKSKLVTFNIQVCQIPRMGRLCLSIYHLKKGRTSMLAWVNRNIFTYKREMMPRQTQYMWDTPIGHPPSHGLLNPYKTSHQNFNFKAASSMEVGLTNTTQCRICFPPDITSAEIPKDIPDTRRKTLDKFQEELESISYRDPLHPIQPQEKELLWDLRWDCRTRHPTILPRIVDCVDYTDNRQVRGLHHLLTSWPEIPLEKALQLLDYAYPDERVHEFAVRCLERERDEKLELYMSQLVQALKHQNFFASSLVRLLLKRALTNQRLGHRFFWSLRSELRECFSTLSQALLLEAYLLAAPEHLKVLKRQRQFLNTLKSITDTLCLQEERNPEITFERRKEIFMESLKRSFSKGEWSNAGSHSGSWVSQEGFISPKDPGIMCRKILLNECSLMKSKKKPLKIVFANCDSVLGMDKKLAKVAFLFKCGDDLRQDCLILQMIKVMDSLWQARGQDLRMTVYNVVPTEQDQGLIEFVPGAVTVCKVQALMAATRANGDQASWMEKMTATFKTDVIHSWLVSQNPDPKSLEAALDNFLHSCAGYTVAMFVLGIGDRHNDNIMLLPCGKLFHIDFGHVMGNFKRKYIGPIGVLRERSPMLLPGVFVHAIHRGGEGQFDKFRRLCDTAYLTLRSSGSLLISLLAMMLSTGMPELQCETDLEYMRTRLQLDQSVTEQQAITFFHGEFNTSLKQGYTVTMNWWTHALNQII